MKISYAQRCIYLLGIWLFANSVLAETLQFTIEKGEVTSQGARCITGTCVPETGILRGDFTAQIDGDQILFSNARIKSEIGGFELPEDPNLDSNGTVRDAKFSLDGALLQVKGVIDSRAFDGPLVTYSFTAVASKEAAFDPNNFYTARQDYRKCASPMCGGIFISPVNKRTMRCPDGSRSSECYVGLVDWQGNTSPFSVNADAVLQGKVSKGDKDPMSAFGVFTVAKAYRPAADTNPRGKFVGLENNGIVCITSPCFSFDQYLLNSKRVSKVSRIDLDRVKADKKDVEQAYNIMGNGEVLIAAGYNRSTKEFAGRGRGFVATQFYLPTETEVHIGVCVPGYSETDAGCATRHGCFYPAIELIALGGAPMLDPETGEVRGSISYSCVDSCELPGELIAEGYCQIALP